MSRTVTAALLALASPLVLTSAPAHAAPVLWSSGVGGNNHAYELILVPSPFTGTNNSWFVDKAIANASVFNGQLGYLATVTSPAENAFLLSLAPAGLSQGAGAWIGGKSPEGWLDGPENGLTFPGAGFSNFGGGEPNNAGYAYMIIGSTFAGVNPGQWADDSGVQGIPDAVGDRVIGYFVEYNASTVVPEPASVLLFGSVAAGLVLFRRRRCG